MLLGLYVVCLELRELSLVGKETGVEVIGINYEEMGKTLGSGAQRDLEVPWTTQKVVFNQRSRVPEKPMDADNFSSKVY